MDEKDLYLKLQDYLNETALSASLLSEKITVRGRALSTAEAIGNPSRQDFPLQKGKEQLVQADFRGAYGQAFTASPGDFEGTLEELTGKALKGPFEKASFVATLNAVLRYLGYIEKTVHCKDEDPVECGKKLVSYIASAHGDPHIGLVGFQPALLDACRQHFPVRVIDLDPDNIGKIKCSTLIEDGNTLTEELLDWSELLLVTGSTLANGSIVEFLDLEKPVIFYGTTVAGAAHVLGLSHFCPLSV